MICVWGFFWSRRGQKYSTELFSSREVQLFQCTFKQAITNDKVILWRNVRGGWDKNPALNFTTGEGTYLPSPGFDFMTALFHPQMSKMDEKEKAWEYASSYPCLQQRQCLIYIIPTIHTPPQLVSLRIHTRRAWHLLQIAICPFIFR